MPKESTHPRSAKECSAGINLQKFLYRRSESRESRDGYPDITAKAGLGLEPNNRQVQVHLSTMRYTGDAVEDARGSKEEDADC